MFNLQSKRKFVQKEEKIPSINLKRIYQCLAENTDTAVADADSDLLPFFESFGPGYLSALHMRYPE